MSTRLHVAEGDFRFQYDKKNTIRARKIVQAYPKRFGFITPEDVYVIRNDVAANSRVYAAVSLTPAHLEPFLGMKVFIQVYECTYDQLGLAAKLLVLYHELMHVKEYEGRATYDKLYQLEHHDVQEFSSLIESYGLHWPRKKDLPNILKESVTINAARSGATVLG